MTTDIYSNLEMLGANTQAPKTPEEAILETVPNPQQDVNYCIRFTAPEFTSICPVTGQPDFAHIVLDIIPDKLIVESKSLKLYLTSFRNHGAFHEDCTISIARKIEHSIKPQWLRICGFWYPRGGIPIDVFYQTGVEPKGVLIPKVEVQPYRGRG